MPLRLNRVTAWFKVSSGVVLVASLAADAPAPAEVTVPDLTLAAPVAAPFPDSSAIRLVRTAQALERAGDSVGARTSYLQAANDLPPIRDWLRLRAAALIRDSADRAALYHMIEAPPAVARIGPLEASIRERLGELSAAITERVRLGQITEALRLRLRTAASASARAGVLEDVIAFVRTSPASVATAGAVELAAPFAGSLGSDDILVLARAAAEAGVASRAVTLFSRALRGGARPGPADRLAWGRALADLGRNREAAAQFARITSGPLLGQAMFERGCVLVRSRARGQGRAQLEALLGRMPKDPAGAKALYLLADLARDVGDFIEARRLWLEVGARFPGSAPAARSRFLAALVRWNQGEFAEAAHEWDSLRASPNSEEEAPAAGYWAGRAWQRSGDSVKARQRWMDVVRSYPLSYYAGRSAVRLGQARDLPPPARDEFPEVPDVEVARVRLRLLVETDLWSELDLEHRWLASGVDEGVPALVTTGDLLRAFGRASLSAQLGWRALRRGAVDGRTYRLIFPVLLGDRVINAARRNGVDPALVVALIRQESVFDSTAMSRAGARGLMQIMPALGRSLARSRVRSWHPDSLYHANLNLELGSSHLALVLRQYPGLERALAAYNAGGSRVVKWNRNPGAGDPEVFVEWIPFQETRTYVRTILRNLEFYRALYDWPVRNSLN